MKLLCSAGPCSYFPSSPPPPPPQECTEFTGRRGAGRIAFFSTHPKSHLLSGFARIDQFFISSPHSFYRFFSFFELSRIGYTIRGTGRIRLRVPPSHSYETNIFVCFRQISKSHGGNSLRYICKIVSVEF